MQHKKLTGSDGSKINKQNEDGASVGKPSTEPFVVKSFSSGDFRSSPNVLPAAPKARQKRRLWLKITLASVVLLLVVGGVMAAKTYLSLRKVVQKREGVAAPALAKEVTPATLKGEGDGRVNVLLLGKGDAGHAGEELTDTIMVASYDVKNNQVALLSIPRDLYVKIPGVGWDKINSANAYGQQTKQTGGPELVKQTVSKILDVPVHYYVLVDFSALRQSVDAVGGIDNIVVEQDLYDPEYPCDNNESRSCGFRLKAGTYNMDGATALKYSRCRKGDCGDDYGRAKRQQQVLMALREKALKQSILTDPGKILNMINIVSNNIKTDLQPSEIQRLGSIAKDLNPKDVTNQVLDVDNNGLVKNAAIGNASVVVPAAGIGEYSDIQAFVRTLFVDGYIKAEGASVQIDNASSQSALAVKVASLLKSYGYNVIKTVSADKVAKTAIVDCTNGGKPYTLQYLQNRFGVAPQACPQTGSGAPPPADIRIILGGNYYQSQRSN
ncbi:LCP family protein [Candidatus Saccharibacteria bacterium]|nr:LCP family protein [Candidatus Saccharibacteria bacterium]